MNPQTAALFATHKGAIFAAAAVAAVGLGLYTKKKGATSTTTSAGTTSTIPGTIPAAAVVAPTTGGVYDSSSFDAYNALQPELEQILQTQGSAINTAPTPVASTLFAPTYNGQYVAWANGETDEVESDGSLLHLTPDQYNQAGAVAGGAIPVQHLQQTSPGSIYSTGGNLTAKNG